MFVILKLDFLLSNLFSFIWSTTTLLNLALQIKQYNKRYKTKDPTKKPAIVYLTLENSKRETFSRMFSMSTDAGRITDYEVDDAGNIKEDKPLESIVRVSSNYQVW